MRLRLRQLDVSCNLFQIVFHGLGLWRICTFFTCCAYWRNVCQQIQECKCCVFMFIRQQTWHQNIILSYSQHMFILLTVSWQYKNRATNMQNRLGVPATQDNPLWISWHDTTWIPILNPANVLDYFMEKSNPFYDRTCNNEIVKMQRQSLEHLKWVEFGGANLLCQYHLFTSSLYFVVHLQ